MPDQHCNSCFGEEFGKTPMSTSSSALSGPVPPCRGLQRGLNSSSFHTGAGYILIMLRFIPLSLTIKHSFMAAGAAVDWNPKPKPAPLDWVPESAGPPPAQTSAPRAGQSQLVLAGDHVLLQRGGKAFL